MSGPTQYFILLYDLTMRHVDVHEFGSDVDQANQAYSELEDQFGPQQKYEIVLVGADSLDTIKRTHSPYFTSGTTRDVVDRFIQSIN